MLIIARSMRELSFGKLMEVYREGNLEKGRELWPEESPARQMALAEQDFYQYLQQVFFKTDGAAYLIWEEDHIYASALRLEPYRDGLLLTALETIPEMRRLGYGKRIVMEALKETGGTKIYSHVGKKNLASLQTHEACGCVRMQDFAVYADGSVDNKAWTLCYQK